MDNSIKVFNFGSLLIESPQNESQDHFREHVTEMLAEIYGKLPPWLKFKVGRRIERGGIFYREFLCPAGSVDSRIQLAAQQSGGISRAIILRGTRSGSPYFSEIRLGIETEFDCKELREVTVGDEF